MNRLVLTAALLAAAGSGCSLKPQRTEARAAEPAYVFPHNPHLDGDVACTACHAAIATESALVNGQRDVRMPTQRTKDPVCSPCHEKETTLVVPKRAAISPVRPRFFR